MKTATLFLTLGLTFGLHKARAGGEDSVGTNATQQAFSVNIMRFEADLTTDGLVKIDWRTSMEAGVDYYSVERSGDAVHFTELARVNSEFTVNTNAFQLFYNTTDDQPLAGPSFYRLKIVGKGQQVMYSSVAQVDLLASGTMKIYPTVLEGNTLFVECDRAQTGAVLEFYDLGGRKLASRALNTLSVGRQAVEIPAVMSQVPAGNYVVRLTAAGKPLMTRLLVVASR